MTTSGMDRVEVVNSLVLILAVLFIIQFLPPICFYCVSRRQESHLDWYWAWL
jgi:hypothetical protein